MRFFPFVILALMILPSSVYADPITFTAILSGLNENPVNASPATGLATVILDPTAHLLRIDVSFSGLGSNATAAHIHCCTSPPNNLVSPQPYLPFRVSP